MSTRGGVHFHLQGVLVGREEDVQGALGHVQHQADVDVQVLGVGGEENGAAGEQGARETSGRACL